MILRRLRPRSRGVSAAVDPVPPSPPPDPVAVRQAEAQAAWEDSERRRLAAEARVHARRVRECQFCETTLLVVDGRCEHCGAPENLARHPDAPPSTFTDVCINCGHAEHYHRARRGSTRVGCHRSECRCMAFADAPWIGGS